MSLLTTLLVLAALFLAARVAIPRLSSSVAAGPVERDGQRRLADCPDSPNCQGSDSSRESQRVAPFPMRGSTTETMAALAALLEARPEASVVSRDADYLHATFTSSLMGYTDDVEFLVDESAGEVRVRSASRLGRSDLGANAKRLASLRETWTDDRPT